MEDVGDEVVRSGDVRGAEVFVVTGVTGSELETFGRRSSGVVVDVVDVVVVIIVVVLGDVVMVEVGFKGAVEVRPLWEIFAFVFVWLKTILGTL